MKFTDHPKACFALVLIGSVLLNVSAALVLRSGLTVRQLDADEVEYYDLAGQINDGTYDFNSRRVLGHLLLLSPLRRIFDDRLLPIQLVLSTLFSLTAPMAYALARRELRDGGAALLGGLGVMLWPLFVRYGATLYTESVALPLFAGLLLAMPGPWKPGEDQRGRWLVAGVVLGLCMHYRPMYLLYSPFAALIAYWRGPGGRRGVARAALLAAGCLAVVLPWSAFMTLREGSPVLLCSEGGETIAGGLNPELVRIGREHGVKIYKAPDGRVVWTGPGKWSEPAGTGYLTPQELRLPYTQMSHLLARRALSWIGSHPGDASYLTLRKLLYMWGIYPLWNGLSQTLLGNIPTIVVLVLAIAALIALRGCLRQLAIFWTLPLFVSAVAIISWGSWRFRQPGDLGLILLAAALPFTANIRSAMAGGGESFATPPGDS